jgi:hypothetical protein
MKPPSDPILCQADDLLSELSAAEQAEASLAARYQAQMDALKHDMEIERAIVRESRDLARARLVAFAKYHRAAVFGGADRRDLPHGALLLASKVSLAGKQKVSISAVERYGSPEDVRVVKSVNWDTVGNWPDERLILIGVTRKCIEAVEYELKAEPSVQA